MLHKESDNLPFKLREKIASTILNFVTKWWLFLDTHVRESFLNDLISFSIVIDCCDHTIIEISCTQIGSLENIGRKL